jgi:hypothetical protein
MTSKLILLISFATATGFFPSQAAAHELDPSPKEQESKNEVLGVVYHSENRKPLRDVVVTAYHNAQKKETRTVTDQQGNYFFNDLKPGTYRIVFELEGYRKISREKVMVKTDDGFHLDIGLEEVNDFQWIPSTFNFWGTEK